MRRFATFNLILLLVIVVLANLVSRDAFFRVDLTSSGAYRLSDVTRETLARAEDPLRVKVFYSDQVPAPYNSVRRYLLDLLREFDVSGGSTFSWEAVDVSTPEGRAEAAEYGLQQVEIQEVRTDEFQSRAVFLGAAVLYGSAAEPVDRITATEGLEYRLTTAMRSAITQVDALAGTTEPVRMHAFVSPGLSELGIEGMQGFPDQLREIFESINRDHHGRLQFELSEPRGTEVDVLTGRFGLQPVQWQSPEGVIESGLLEVALHVGDAPADVPDRVQRVPIEIYSGIFGGYSVADPEEIEQDLRQALRTLVAANPRVAYATGAGERALDDYRLGAAPFRDLLRERFEVVAHDPAEGPIPPDIDTLIINGPREVYTAEALYWIDQFVMSGGRLLLLLDRFTEEMPTQQAMMQGAQPEWRQVATGLERLVSHYGAEVSEDLVLDEEGFVATLQGRRQTIFQAPLLRGASLNRESVITRALEDVIVLNATEIRPAPGGGDPGRGNAQAPGDVDPATPRFTPLLETSPRSWTVDHPGDAGPWVQGAPAGATTDRYTVAAVLEGVFESYFSGPPDGRASVLTPDRHRSRSVEPGRMVLISTSELTTAQLIDPQNRTPNGTFLMNVVDYLKDAPGFAELRSKGLGVPRLEVTSPAVPGVVRWLNVIGVPLLVIAIGLLVASRRKARSRRIEVLFSDHREEH